MCKKTLSAIFSTLLLLVVLSCAGEKNAVSAVSVPRYTQAVITFTTGEVFVSRTGEWLEAEINDFIETGDRVKVESDSFCEIQFGNKAVIKIEENTELTVPVLRTEPGQTDISLKIVTGAVLSKVNKLAGKEAYEVETQSAACGVRGTEFMVSADDEASTVLAVRDGSVLFVPSEFDLESLKAKIPSGETEALSIIENIEKALTVVGTEQEIEIETHAAEKINISFKSLEKAAEKIGEASSREAGIDEMQQISGEIISALSPPSPLTEENREAMKDLDSMMIRELPDPDSEEMSSALLKVSVNVIPDDAEIIRNGRVIGKGSFSAIVGNGEEVSLLVRKKGYLEKNYSFTASADSENAHSITLEKDESYRELSKITVKALPGDSEIAIDGITEGTGTVEKEVPPEGSYSILVTREGYQKKQLTVSNPSENHVEEITLLPLIEKRIKASGVALTGYMAFGSGMIFAADSYGELMAAAPSGKLEWKIQTGNTPNERAYPVAYRNNVFFSGASEFIVAEMKTGKIVSSEILDDDMSHVFGRRVVITGERGLYPANSGLFVFNPDSGEITGDIPVPDGTRMTPGIYGSEILIVNQKGTFYRIDPSSGKIITSIQTGAVQPVVNNVAVKGNRAYFNGKNGDIVCIDLETDSVIWKKPLMDNKSRMITGDLQCGESGVYAYSDGQIFSFSASSGERIFAPIPKVTSPPTLSGGRLYYGTSDGKFNVIDAETGKIIESFSIGAKVTASPYFDRGKVYAGTDTGEILVLNP